MKILVTGGGGYLGCRLCPLLIEHGHEVRLFDRFCFGEEAIAGFASDPRCEVVRGDIRRLQDHPRLLDGVAAIVHLAGLSNDPSCDLDPEMTVDVNVESTRKLAQRAVEAGVRRFVFSSSCSVYGKGVFEVLDETSPANPVSSYAESKLEGEKILLGMKGADFEPVFPRFATLFGWSPRMRFDLAINQMVATAARQGVINILGGGNQWRPFLHVCDAARAILAMLEAPPEKVSGEVFNVGSNEANLKIIDLGKRVAAHFDGVALRVAPDDEDARNYRVVFRKVRERLGFECAYTIEDGIKEVKHVLAESDIDPQSNRFFNVRRMKELLATPVDEGGEPVAPRFIPLAKPNLGPDEEQAVIETLRSGWITSGPQIQAFEKAFGETVGAEHVVAVSSCTAALHLCLAHYGLRPGDEVITSPITWASTGNTILTMGAKPVFADIDPGTLNVVPEDVERKITERTRVIMPVHMAGQPCDLDAIYAIGAKHGVPVVEDAAHALGAGYKGRPIGSFGNLACFSFYAIKNITTIEGGAITTRDPEVADHLRLLSGNGMPVNAWERYGPNAVPAPPEVFEPGYKYLMGNINAAMGIEQLKKFPAFKAARRRLAGLYRTAFEDVEELRMLDTREDVDHAWHLFIIRLRLDRLTKTRDEIAQALRRENIGTGFHFYGLHLHRYYREALGMRPEDLPEATKASHEILSLPLHPGMTDKNVREVVAAVKKVVAHSRRRR